MKSLGKTRFYVEPDIKKSSIDVGIEVEMEHTKDKKEAKKIAEDHLAEDKDYYKDWENKEKILFQPKAPKVKSMGDRLRKLYERRVDTSLPDAPSFEEWRDGLQKGSEVAVVAVVHEGKVLMGQRKDNDRWTLPGGHVDDGEKPKAGAVRELHEEANIKAKNLKKLVTEDVVTHTGKKLKIHAYVMNVNEKPKPDSKNDPDDEMKRFKWVNLKNFPKEIKENLHAKKDVALHKLGAIKSMFFITDLIKGARSHKYIRKYQRGGKWIYIYHEGEGRTRNIPEEAIKRIKELAELGDKDAKHLHDNIQEYAPAKLKLLHELADLGDEDAKKHLQSLGIDHDVEKLARRVEPDPVHQNLRGQPRDNAIQAIESAVGTKIFDYLSNHRQSPFAVALARNVGEDFTRAKKQIMTAIEGKQSVAEMLEELHRQMNRIEAGMPAASTSANNEVKTQGGYGQVAYNAAIKGLITKGVLPEGYESVHRRTPGSAEHQVQPVREIQAEIERKRREEEEKLRREAGELQDSMAMHMVGLMAGAGRMSARDKINKAREINNAIKHVFGSTLTKEQWPYDFSANGLKTEIRNISSSGTGFDLDMQVYDANGNPMMENWRRSFSKQNGRPQIYNSYMAVAPGARGGVQVGNLINQGQRKLMKSIPGGGVVKVTANIDVGGYNWANQGFSFADPSTLNSYRQSFKAFLASNGVNLSDADLQRFTEPVHFAQFTNGKKYVQRTSDGDEIKLSDQQLATRSLTGVAGEHPLTDAEIRSGKSDRIAVNLGKKFMLGKHWSGVWDSHRETDASKFADRYYELRDRAVDVLKTEFKDLMSDVKAGNRAAPAPRPAAPARPATPTPTSSRPASTSGEVQRAQDYLRYWAPRPGMRNIRMTERRERIVASWPEERYAHFMANAQLTPAARRSIVERRRQRT